MKKLILIIVSISIFLSLKAQISITQNDFGPIGATITLADDTLPSTTLDLGTPGTGKIWDFTMLNNHYTYQYAFVNVSASPFALDFPNANMAIQILPQNFYYYLNSGSTSFLALGQSGDFLGIGTDLAIHLDPADKIMEFPATYLSTFNANSMIDETYYYGQSVSGFMVDSIRMKSVTQKSSLIDAWGTLTTTEGSFPSLREKRYEFGIDSTWGYIMGTWVEFGVDTTENFGYSWYANGIGMPIVEIDYDTATNKATFASWVLPSLTITDVQDNSSFGSQSTGFDIFPNPVQNELYLQQLPVFESCVVNVYDLTGRCLIQKTFNNNNSVFIKTADLSSGVYMIEVSTDGVRQETMKFVKK